MPALERIRREGGCALAVSGEVEYFGPQRGVVSDVDGDGVPDLVVGMSGFEVGPGEFVGAVRLYSVKTGTVLYQWDGGVGIPSDRSFGSAIATGVFNSSLDGSDSDEGALFQYLADCH